jgi:predicted flavoprotein YhiN
MVTESEITHIMNTWFYVDGAWHVNAQGLVDVQGYCELKPHPDGSWPEIPVQFGHVTGEFKAAGVGLHSLKNSPRRVYILTLSNNKLQSLAHAPDQIDQELDASHNPLLTELSCAHTHVMGDLVLTACDLVSLKDSPQGMREIWVELNPRLTELKHMPECEALWISYHPDLALLPALKAQALFLRDMAVLADRKVLLRQIMKKYQGQGKRAMLNCALELKQAGFGSNARW